RRLLRTPALFPCPHPVLFVGSQRERCDPTNRTGGRGGGQARARYWERPPTASLLSRFDRCRPSSTSSTAEAITPALACSPTSWSTGAPRAGISVNSVT